jgi:predicted porin
MKKLHAFAVLAAISASASAQSSVTLFGVIDATVGTIHNGAAGNTKYVGASGNETSRLGFRGTEDLGGGLRAGFWLEGELFTDTGNPSGFNFMRRSTVSLSNERWGELRLGRDMVATYQTRSDFDPFGNNGVGAQGNLLALNQPIQLGNQTGPFAGAVNTTPLGSGAPTLRRTSNAIGYFLPGQLAGVYGQAMFAPGEDGPGLGNYAGGRLGYRQGPWNVAGAYGRTQLTAAGSNKETEWDLGVSYDFDVVKVMAQYNKLSWDRDDGTSDLGNVMIGATAPLGPGVLKASYSRAKISGAPTGVTGLGNGTAHMAALGYVYDLSKRTAIYTTVSHITNDDGTQFTVGQQGNGPSMLVNGQFLSGQSSNGYEIGIRHRF